MHYMQFRIHPSVGMARIGDSPDAYYLASDFPQYLQEEFAELRLRPRPRTLPPVTSAAAPAGFDIFDDQKGAPKARRNRFKDRAGKVLPQAARFRVFAYVYRSKKSKHPCRVFEVTTDHADIEWKVSLANLKSQKTGSGDGTPVRVEMAAPASANTSSAELRQTPVKPDPATGVPAAKRDRPPLGYLFLERKPANKAEVNGRLHLIGNKGELEYFGTGAAGDELDNGFSSLWFNDWFDSACDGPVEAVIRPKNNGAQLRAEAQINSAGDVEYLDQGEENPKASSTASINAAPAWAVVGLPNYTPDMGHFVSLWDLALSQSLTAVSEDKIKNAPGHHRLIRCKSETERYKKMDYRVHIHPQLCLFEDVNWVSAASGGENTNQTDKGHNKYPAGTASASSDPPDNIRSDQIEKGGVSIRPRVAAERAKLEDPKQLKDPDPKKPIQEWLKPALFGRLRGPDTLYRKKRSFYQGSSKVQTSYPRHLGRRSDFPGTERNGFPVSAIEMPDQLFSPAGGKEDVPGNLKRYHGNITGTGTVCGRGGAVGLKSGASHPTSQYTFDYEPDGTPKRRRFDQQALEYLDDMYWPASAVDMPLLRELAYTHVQYEHFKIWKSDKPDARELPIFTDLIAPSMEAELRTTKPDVDEHFDYILGRRSKHVPAMLDMASLGTMLGGSFLPGIEVGLEGGRRENWTVYHGACKNFPDVRFELSTKNDANAQHFAGKLTKDLAIPWTVDYVACTEDYWPTSRPGVMVPAAGGATVKWFVDQGAQADVDYYRTYWTQLSFIRRDDANGDFRQEASP